MTSATLSNKKNRHLTMPCTFIVKVLHTDQSTVQGHIQWIEKERTVAFRSYMELMHLTQEALKYSSKKSVDFRSWKS